MDEQKEITVFIVDDHQVLREQLRKFIIGQENMKVVGEASNGEQAIKILSQISPDIITMDVNLPEMNGIEATKKITSIMPDAIVIGLSLHSSQDMIEGMRMAGASAYITKEKAFEKLCTTIKKEVSLKKKTSNYKNEKDNTSGSSTN